MFGRSPSNKKDFKKVLEQAEQVDEIFKDAPMPRGSNPFGLPPKDEQHEDLQGAQQTTESYAVPSLGTEDDSETLLCVNRKLAGVEALFRLVAREYYSFGQLISEILRITMEQIKSESGSFIEIDHTNHNMFFRAVTGRSSENLLSFTIPLGKGVAGFVCETQQPMVLSNVEENQVHLRSISASVGFETKNLMAYPVVVRGVTFGCLELLNRLGETSFTEADKEVMSTLADYAGKVIENRLVMSALAKGQKGAPSGEEEAA